MSKHLDQKSVTPAKFHKSQMNHIECNFNTMDTIEETCHLQIYVLKVMFFKTQQETA